MRLFKWEVAVGPAHMEIVDSGISKSCGFSTKKDELGIYLKKRR
jgi:hypothetical protein